MVKNNESKCTYITMILLLADQRKRCSKCFERYTVFSNKKALALSGEPFVVQIIIKTIRKVTREID